MRGIFRLKDPFRERKWKDVDICFRLCGEHNEKLLQNGGMKSSKGMLEDGLEMRSCGGVG